MSKYTTEVRYICEVAAGLAESADYTGVEDVIKKALPVVFDFSFPIFDESYRSVLETKILKHFYTREIGLETVGLWKLKLNTKLNEIMPYYNKLYKSELINFNPLYNIDITRDHKLNGNETKNANTIINGTLEITKNNNESNTGTSKDVLLSNSAGHDVTAATGKTINKYSDTPQGAINGLENDTYLTNATINTNTGNTTNDNTLNNTSNEDITTTNETTAKSDEAHTNKANNSNDSVLVNTEDYLEHISGKEGSESYSDLLTKYRNTFLNIDMLVIIELENLFMQLW